MTVGNRQKALRNSKRLKLVACAVCTLLFALCSSVQAQQPTKIPRIGLLSSGEKQGSSEKQGVEVFSKAMRGLGYAENQTVAIESRYAEGVTERLPNLATELVNLKVDVIVAIGTPAARAAKSATQTIPIVIDSVTDPVGTGLVASLAHPGGNVTGLSNLFEDLGEKQMELLKELSPKISRVAVFWDPANAAHVLWLRKLNMAAGALGVTVQSIEVHSRDDLEPAFAATKREGSAFIVLANALTGTYRSRIIDFAVKSRLPGMYPVSSFTEAGGLISYGENRADSYRRIAFYVDRILKGIKPADLPVEQPTKFEMVINLKAAKQIGLTIPPNVLARADKVIR